MEYINVMAEDKYLVVFVSLNLEKVQSICYIRGEKSIYIMQVSSI